MCDASLNQIYLIFKHESRLRNNIIGITLVQYHRQCTTHIHIATYNHECEDTTLTQARVTPCDTKLKNAKLTFAIIYTTHDHVYADACMDATGRLFPGIFLHICNVLYGNCVRNTRDLSSRFSPFYNYGNIRIFSLYATSPYSFHTCDEEFVLNYVKNQT